MTAADKRMEELLDRWMASLELHARYLRLDDAEYARAEKWPEHQRPTKWIIDLARQRVLELRAQLQQRRAAGDATFTDALELMSFLSTLLGSEHLERFIPMASGKAPGASVSGTVEQPHPRAAKPRTAPNPAPAAHRQPTPQRTSAPQKAGAPTQRTTTARPASGEPRRASRTAPPGAAAVDPASAQVIADAVRMLEWGREWPALAGLIARMADRPPEAEVWKILRTHRSQILTKARRPVD
jgi:hypothetical protein